MYIYNRIYCFFCFFFHVVALATWAVYYIYHCPKRVVNTRKSQQAHHYIATGNRSEADSTGVSEWMPLQTLRIENGNLRIANRNCKRS